MLARHLGITQKSAWSMAHRIRYMLKPPGDGPPLDGIVEIDTVTIGGNPRRRNIRKYGAAGKYIITPRGRGSPNPTILVAVERPSKTQGSGRIRSQTIDNLSAKTLIPLIQNLISPDAVVHSDADAGFRAAKKPRAGEKPIVADHQTVTHSRGEYARGEVHANRAEAFHGIVRRALIGIHHYWSEEHQQAYLDELAFRISHRSGTPAETNTANVLTSLSPPMVAMMEAVFANAFGREMRRTDEYGLRKHTRAPAAEASIADGDGLAPSVESGPGFDPEEF